MISLKKLLVNIFIFSVSATLCLPVAAQDMKPMEKLYCPYCGMVNLTTIKFCGVCGARLPNPAEARLKMMNVNMPTSSSRAVVVTSDNLETKSFYNDEVVQSFRQQGSVAGPIAAGLLAGAIGFFAGGFIGAEIDVASSNGYEEWDGVAGFVLGAPIGEAVFMPLGVHLANGRRGNFPLTLLASIGIAGTGIGLTLALDDYRTPVFTLPLTALTQLIACVAIERTTAGSH
jgi:hypothetical protein